MGSALRSTFTLLAIVLVFGKSYQCENGERNLLGITGFTDAELVRQSNDFAIHLYKQVSAETRDGNVVISPLSISACLSLAAMGAGGLTAEEMFGGLRYGKADQKQRVADWYGRLMRQLASDSSIAVANTLYVKEGYTVKRSFNDVATNSFQSEVHELNFAQNEAAAKTINDWVERKTNNKIKDLILPNMLDDQTFLMLVNAVHFKGYWINPFEAPTPMQFWLSETESHDVPIMYVEDKFAYENFSDKGFSALELSYDGSDTTMLVLLPNERNGLAALEETLSSLNLVELRNQLMKTKVALYLPKFKIDFSLDLKKVLSTLGMGRMFSNAAEFPDLLESNESLKITTAVHKAFIEVNEEGTEAAAAAAMEGIEASCIYPSLFLADHPFIYALLSGDGAIYFIGKVTNPA
ncbi:antichymotrypsin-2-like isoform X2 [Anopheles aquasalis]|uniref:antichymotrypsin-2-like isoform X2 n=1 Tax=Anopheles aquasalis TaxID=42839 RepID=UPI00215B0413|nr:antichymotrypsin-2-like isoform X2 [Anopheles aquasalis]